MPIEDRDDDETAAPASGGDLFADPEGFYEQDPPEYAIDSSYKGMQIRLIGRHPLWGHLLWNASRCLAQLFDNREIDCTGKRVLELGAGGALPSITSALNGAKKVVITDYPDEFLLDNIRHNVDSNIQDPQILSRIVVRGHIWGAADVEQILDANDDGCPFDLILLSDLIFNHSQHTNLLQTCFECLKGRVAGTAVGDQHLGQALVCFSHHRPHKVAEDMQFFQLAKEAPFGFNVEHLFTRRFQPMFEADPGPEEVRAAVHLYRMTLPHFPPAHPA